MVVTQSRREPEPVEVVDPAIDRDELMSGSGSDSDTVDEVEEIESGLRELELAKLKARPKPKPKPSRQRTACFRFLDLPAELRMHIYRLHLISDKSIDLDPTNAVRIGRRLGLLRACRRIHDEAFPIFYGENIFRVFPTHPRFIRKKKTLLSRMTPRQRAALTTLELRLGPDWASPPKAWVVNDKLGLRNATSVTKLRVFVEIDPSHDIFRGFRIGKDFYTVYSVDLVRRLCKSLPSIQEIHFDAWESVTRKGLIMSALEDEAKTAKKRVLWSATREW